MREAFDQAELDHLASQQSKRPTISAFRGLRASQPDQVCFVLPVYLTLIHAVRFFSVNSGLQAFLVKFAAHAGSGGLAYFQGFGGLLVAPGGAFLAFIKFQKQASAGLFACRAAATPDYFKQVAALVGG
jgi:hypothetical protein